MPYYLDNAFLLDKPWITVVGCGGTGGFVAEGISGADSSKEGMPPWSWSTTTGWSPTTYFGQNFYAADVGKPQEPGPGRQVGQYLRAAHRLLGLFLSGGRLLPMGTVGPAFRPMATDCSSAAPITPPHAGPWQSEPGGRPVAHRRRQRHQLGTGARRQCAASRGIGYLIESGETRRKFLGQPTYLEAKALGFY